jgi:hypothetical protein
MNKQEILSQKILELQHLQSEILALQSDMLSEPYDELWHQRRNASTTLWQGRFDEYEGENNAIHHWSKSAKDDYCDECGCKIIKWRGCNCD